MAAVVQVEGTQVEMGRLAGARGRNVCRHDQGQLNRQKAKGDSHHRKWKTSQPPQFHLLRGVEEKNMGTEHDLCPGEVWEQNALCPAR